MTDTDTDKRAVLASIYRVRKRAYISRSMMQRIPMLPNVALCHREWTNKRIWDYDKEIGKCKQSMSS